MTTKTTRYGVLLAGALMPTTHLSREAAYRAALAEERAANLEAEVVTLEITVRKDFTTTTERTATP